MIDNLRWIPTGVHFMWIYFCVFLVLALFKCYWHINGDGLRLRLSCSCISVCHWVSISTSFGKLDFIPHCELGSGYGRWNYHLVFYCCTVQGEASMSTSFLLTSKWNAGLSTKNVSITVKWGRQWDLKHLTRISN